MTELLTQENCELIIGIAVSVYVYSNLWECDRKLKFPVAAVTSDRVLTGLKQSKFITLPFRMSDIQNGSH